MPRKPSGQIIETPTADGDVAIAIRFPAYGKRPKVTLGLKSDGWTRERAQTELENVLADVRRGIWKPAEPKPVVPESDGSETFHEFASRWYQDREPEWREATRIDYRWALSKHLLPTFGSMALSEISAESVDRYARAKQAEREKPVKGRHGLSNNSINKTLYLLSSILDVAVEYERIARNPAKGKRRRLKGEQRNRPVVFPEQLLTLIGVCDSTMRPLVATLGGAGLRIGEAIALRWQDVNLATGTIRVRGAKTDAGVRTVDLSMGLAEELRSWKARSSATKPIDAVFRKRDGGPQTRKNAQGRLKTMIALANEKLEASGIEPISTSATPHALRRGFASLRSYVDRDPAYVMEQMGHTEAEFTLRVYARALKRRQRMEGETLRQFDAAVDWARLGTNAPEPETIPAAERIPEPFSA